MGQGGNRRLLVDCFENAGRQIVIVRPVNKYQLGTISDAFLNPRQHIVWILVSEHDDALTSLDRKVLRRGGDPVARRRD